jgi:hypothetical protein
MVIPVSGIGSSDPSPATPARPARPSPAAAPTEPVHKPAPVQPVQDTVELSDADQAEILKRAGASMKEIAGILGLTEQMVTTILSPPRVHFPIVK